MQIDDDLVPMTAVLSMDVTNDAEHVVLTGCLESGNLCRLPMTAAVAMRVLVRLWRLQQEHAWPLPPNVPDGETGE